jgi:hypothetical protein
MISKQEMFNRAVVGLRSQGFERCQVNGDPVYGDDKGCHCAWGWVDPVASSKPEYARYFINGLMADGVGLAAGLTLTEVTFATQLQRCHDDSRTPFMMERRLKQLGAREGLSWPE